MTAVSDHLSTVRDVLNMAEVPYVDDFYRAHAALDDAAAEHRAEVDRLRRECEARHAEQVHLADEVDRLRAELAAAREALREALTVIERTSAPSAHDRGWFDGAVKRIRDAAHGDETP